MEHRTDDLWTGGPWEQPARPVPPFRRRYPTAGRPVLRVRRRRSRLRVLAALALAALLCAGVLGVGGQLFLLWQYGGPGGDPIVRQAEDSTLPPAIRRAETGTGVTVDLKAAAGEPLAYDRIYQKNVVSMVSIRAESDKTVSSGTGIILTEDGYLITNAHVVAGADRVQAVFWNNRAAQVELVGFNAGEDLAVLKANVTGLTPAEFGSSDALHCGDPVAALGDPLGYRSSITDGIVSALDRDVSMGGGRTMQLIQTSAAINFGNSGGALINQYGQVVGVTTIKIVARDGSTESMGFAIPSVRVKYVVDRLIAGEPVRTAALGITVSTVQADEGGLEVLLVDASSDAAAQGIRPGDVLKEVNGQTITGADVLRRLKLTMAPGDRVTLTWTRDGQSRTAQVAMMDADDMGAERSDDKT